MKYRLKLKKVHSGSFDVILFGIVMSLTLFGLLMIYNSSSVIAYNLFENKYRFIRDQMIWFSIGLGALYFFYKLDYRSLYNLALPSLVAAIGLLVLVFVPGIGAGALGAKRWVDFGFFTLQPAEFVKLGLSLYLAAWFSHKGKKKLGSFILLMGVILFLVMMEPDMGTASIILFESAVVYFLSGGSLKVFFFAAPVILGGALLYIFSAPYRLARLTSFLNLSDSIEATSYHVKQILIALGSGGIFGLGVGNSLQKYSYLPENVTDSIFPIIAEEFGFIGAVILILVYIVFIWRGMYIASKARDSFGKLLAGGIISFIGIQAVINLAAMTALVPLTGVPLPFISYGGSALVVDLAAIGILLNIRKNSV